MDANGLINAMVARLVILGNQRIEDSMDHQWRAGMFDMTVHAVSVARDLSPKEAEVWLAEEIQERICAMAD